MLGLGAYESSSEDEAESRVSQSNLKVHLRHMQTLVHELTFSRLPKNMKRSLEPPNKKVTFLEGPTYTCMSAHIDNLSWYSHRG